MGNASSTSVSRWDDLFQALTRPEDLKQYLEQALTPSGDERPSVLQTQVDLLAGTLQVEASLLKVNEVAESFDTATFCLGQLVSHEPQLMSELPFATTVVTGLSRALRKGWLVHHGVGKFAANALTILCVCETAVLAVRELAFDELIAGLLEWLHSSDSPAEEVDEVCGCNCGNAALSAACWLEVRLGSCMYRMPPSTACVPPPAPSADSHPYLTLTLPSPHSIVPSLALPQALPSQRLDIPPPSPPPAPPRQAGCSARGQSSNASFTAYAVQRPTARGEPSRWQPVLAHAFA